MNTVKNMTHTSEWEDTIKELESKNITYKSFRYFLNLGRDRADREMTKALSPRIITLGDSFPMEIVRALHVPFYNISGGSMSAAMAGEPLVPRDTDSAIKHILGLLTDEEMKLTEKAIILIPLTCDSMRKISAILDDYAKVITYELPCDKSDPLQQERWESEVLRVTYALERHTRKLLTRSALQKECDLSARASESWNRFTQVCRESVSSISGSGRLWIADSYSWCENREEWIASLDALTEEIRKHNRKVQPSIDHGHVLLVGSPIYAPNYKTPFLIEEMGMEIYDCIHPSVLRLSRGTRLSGSRNQLLARLTEICLLSDISPAFIANEDLKKAAAAALESGQISGVIAHILKGQIEYDFELNRMESTIDEFRVPVFRLETDYNYQDVEQLRIRLEAFAEMLMHRANMHWEARHVKEAI